MKISNLSELLNATVINEASILSVEGFSLDAQGAKYAFGLFSNDEEEIESALKKGIFAVVSEKKLPVKDEEVFYLWVEDLQIALLRLLRFLCEEKNVHFILCESQTLKFCQAFFLKKLKGKVFLDFESLNNAQNGEIFCFDEANYLLKLCANYEELKDAKYEILNPSSPFFTSMLCENLCFKSLNLPLIYAKNFAKWINFLQEKAQKPRFELSKLDFYQIYFVGNDNEILPFGKGNRAFIVVFCEEDFDFWRDNFSPQKELKTALKNSLFCDFSYESLGDLRKIKDFRYCLVLAESKEAFLKEFEEKEREEKSLFPL